MPLSKSQIFQRFIWGLESAGATVLHLSPEGSHPCLFRVITEETAITVLAYAWNLTHGGGHRADDEFRIQVTGVSQFSDQAGTETIILGWYEPLEVFAGFDFAYHRTLLGSSPSIQIRQHALRAAESRGFGFHEKETHEIAIAFRPELALLYVQNLHSLHGRIISVEERQAFQEIEDRGALTPSAAVERVPDEPRRKVIRQTLQAVRASDFAKRVLTAYEHKCCFCGIQLNLLDAAHILPVSEPGSTDGTSNGLAMCPLHHRAYDRALCTVDDRYSILRNDRLLDQLRTTQRGDGLDLLFHGVSDQIMVPALAQDRPAIEMIRAANDVRGWNR